MRHRAKTAYESLHGLSIQAPDYQVLLEHLDKESTRVELTWVPPNLTHSNVAAVVAACSPGDGTDRPEVQAAIGKSDDCRVVVMNKKTAWTLPHYIEFDIGDGSHTIAVRVPGRLQECQHCRSTNHWSSQCKRQTSTAANSDPDPDTEKETPDHNRPSQGEPNRPFQDETNRPFQDETNRPFQGETCSPLPSREETKTETSDPPPLPPGFEYINGRLHLNGDVVWHPRKTSEEYGEMPKASCEPEKPETPFHLRTLEQMEYENKGKWRQEPYYRELRQMGYSRQQIGVIRVIQIKRAYNTWYEENIPKELQNRLTIDEG